MAGLNGGTDPVCRSPPQLLPDKHKEAVHAVDEAASDKFTPPDCGICDMPVMNSACVGIHIRFNRTPRAHVNLAVRNMKE